MIYNTLIIGAGASGLFCAMTAASNGKKVLVVDHNDEAGAKIRISGGGRCNFTNIYATFENYVSSNPRFCISALKQFTPKDFIKLLDDAKIPYHEKKLGQMFCDKSSEDIIDLLKNRCLSLGVVFDLGSEVMSVEEADGAFLLKTNKARYTSEKLVVATGGMSLPKLGATDFSYKLARQFKHKIIEPKQALVPLLLDDCAGLSGLSVDAEVKCNKKSFRENILFTHVGLSGPAILQISSYWDRGDFIEINMLPNLDLFAELKLLKQSSPNKKLTNILSSYLPKRLVEYICSEMKLDKNISELKDKELQKLGDRLNHWRIVPKGTQGFNYAEVTKGGVDTKEVSSKTMESQKQAGLYFVGEALDVTGHLGGFNLQWAWSSGYVAGLNQ